MSDKGQLKARAKHTRKQAARTRRLAQSFTIDATRREFEQVADVLDRAEQLELDAAKLPDDPSGS
jgi:hypothetical protein